MLISILACSLCFHAITFECSTFTKIAIFRIKPGSRLVARSGRTRGDRRTDGRTDRMTTKYCNPCCACTPRVNNRACVIAEPRLHQLITQPRLRKANKYRSGDFQIVKGYYRAVRRGERSTFTVRACERTVL